MINPLWKILKYKIYVDNSTNEIAIPWNSKIRSLGVQTPGEICLWIETPVIDSVRNVNRAFHIFGTGHEIPPSLNYVGTVFDDIYVWHVYEERDQVFI